MTDPTTARVHYRAWCLSWDDTEEDGCDVVPYEGASPRGQRGVVHVSRFTLHDASDVAEAYADYVHDQRDGNESSWPLTFRVVSPDGSVQDFSVDRDYVTTFDASPVKPERWGS